MTTEIWAVRINAEFIDNFLAYVKKLKLQYYVVLEFAYPGTASYKGVVNDHYHGVVHATRSQKDNISRTCGKKTDKSFTKVRKETYYPYMFKGPRAKGPGKRGEYPLTVFGNLEFDMISLHNTWWDAREAELDNIVIIRENSNTRQRKTCFQQILDRCDEEYDAIGLYGPNKKRRIITMQDACNLVDHYYGNSRTMGGLFARTKAFEEVMLRYGPERTLRGAQNKRMEKFETAIQ